MKCIYYAFPTCALICMWKRQRSSIYLLSIHGKESAKKYTEMVLVFLTDYFAHIFLYFPKYFLTITLLLESEGRRYKLFFYSWKKMTAATQLSRAGRVGGATCRGGATGRGAWPRGMWRFKPGLPRAHWPTWPQIRTFGLGCGQMRQLGGVQSFLPPVRGWTA